MNRVQIERRGMLASALALGGSVIASRAAAADAPPSQAPAALTSRRPRRPASARA